MAIWRVKGEIGFRTAAARTGFVNDANAWKATRPLLFDRSRLINVGNPDEPQILYPTVRIDAAFVASLHGIDFYDWLRAQPTGGLQVVFLSAHHCPFDGLHDPQPVRYFSWRR